MDNAPILDTIDPEYLDRLATRRSEIARGSWARPGVAAALAIGSVPVALAALSRDVYAQGALPTAVQNAIDFALALEIFENELYKAVLGTSGSPAQNNAFATAKALLFANPVIAATVQQIQKHEQAHADILTASGAVNTLGLTATSFDFTGNRSAAGGGPFTKATANPGFLLEMVQGVEDTGVRAYKGQVTNLMGSPTVLETGLRIHSVEARHASRVRRIRRSLNTGVLTLRYSGTISGGTTSSSDVPAAGITDPGDLPAVVAAFALIYGVGTNATTAPNESNTTHDGVDVSKLSAVTGFTVDAVQQAFDEPLDRADVVAIVQPFFIPTLS